MMHKRRWVVSVVPTMEQLAEMLTQRTWTLCSGFSVDGHPDYFSLNDATHEDGAAEFTIVSGGMSGPHVQIESITFSWCSIDSALDYIRKALAGEYDASSFAHALDLVGRLDPPERHGRCHLCA